MNENEKVSFGKYIETIRKEKRKSLRETAKAIEVSPQFLSEVEKGRKSNPDQMRELRNWQNSSCYLKPRLIHFMIWQRKQEHRMMC